MTSSLFAFDSTGAARVRDDQPASNESDRTVYKGAPHPGPGTYPAGSAGVEGAAASHVRQGCTFPGPSAVRAVVGSGLEGAVLQPASPWVPSVPAQDAREEQERNKARVRTGIGGIILDFCRERGAGGVFTAAELRAYVEARNGGRAPSSADRILRDLRAGKLISYSADKSSRYTLESVSLEAR